VCARIGIQYYFACVYTKLQCALSLSLSLCLSTCVDDNPIDLLAKLTQTFLNAQLCQPSTKVYRSYSQRSTTHSLAHSIPVAPISCPAISIVSRAIAGTAAAWYTSVYCGFILRCSVHRCESIIQTRISLFSSFLVILLTVYLRLSATRPCGSLIDCSLLNLTCVRRSTPTTELLAAAAPRRSHHSNVTICDSDRCNSSWMKVTGPCTDRSIERCVRGTHRENTSSYSIFG